VDALVEGCRRSAQGFEGHGSGEVEELGDAQGAVERERPGCGHGLRAVEEGQAFLGFEGERLDSGFAEGAAGSGALAFVDHFAFADKGECEVGERGEVAAGAD
jgi:hypothetical protein